MKKLCYLFITLFVIMLLVTQKNVYADSKDVVVGSSEEPIYSLDVSWGKMQFVYNRNKIYEWSNETHEYSVNSKYSWNAEGNIIKIKNNSTFAVETNCIYVNTYGNLKGKFSKNNFKVASGKRDEISFSLSGSLSKYNTSFVKVGTLTLKFS